MKKILKALFLLFWLGAMTTGVFAITPTEIFQEFSSWIETLLQPGGSISLGFSFILLFVLFSAIFSRGTIRMFKGNSRAAWAVAIILGIFASTTILYQVQNDAISCGFENSDSNLVGPPDPSTIKAPEKENAIACLGWKVFIPMLLLALFFGSWGVLRGIHNADVGTLGKVFLYTGFLVTLFVLLGMIAATGVSQTLGGILDIIKIIVGALLAIFVLSLIFLFFTTATVAGMFRGDPDAAAKRQRDRQSAQDLRESMNTMRNQLQGMRDSYQQSANLLQELKDEMRLKK